MTPGTLCELALSLKMCDHCNDSKTTTLWLYAWGERMVDGARISFSIWRCKDCDYEYES